MFRFLGFLIGLFFVIGFIIYAVNNFDLVFEAILSFVGAFVGLLILLADKLSASINKNLKK